MTDNTQWFKPLGSIAQDGWQVVVDADNHGWEYTVLKVATLEPGETREVNTGGWEFLVLPLSGAATVAVRDEDGTEHEVDLPGRASVFSGPTDVAYVPRQAHLLVRASANGLRFALCGARAAKAHVSKPFRVIAARQVPVELRGAGTASREVRNFATPEVLDADSIIACEVITPAGNWSSYPPHKHDEERAGKETELEEIYYFEVQQQVGSPVPDDADPVGYARVYGTPERPIDVLAEVRTGDVVLVPHGWHGPVMAPPGYDLYYLNVMAGPGAARAWLICDDPVHGWVRDTWSEQGIDPRLPFGGTA